VRRCEVLELVDEQASARRSRGGTRRRLTQQDLDRLVDLLVEVDRT
jgi:hypothetical protein